MPGKRKEEIYEAEWSDWEEGEKPDVGGQMSAAYLENPASRDRRD